MIGIQAGSLKSTYSGLPSRQVTPLFLCRCRPARSRYWCYSLCIQPHKESAKQLGAKQLYISATPSRRTVDFYMKHGAQPLKKNQINNYWQLEPEDIHLNV